MPKVKRCSLSARPRCRQLPLAGSRHRYCSAPFRYPGRSIRRQCLRPKANEYRYDVRFACYLERRRDDACDRSDAQANGVSLTCLDHFKNAPTHFRSVGPHSFVRSQQFPRLIQNRLQQVESFGSKRIHQTPLSTRAQEAAAQGLDEAAERLGKTPDGPAFGDSDSRGLLLIAAYRDGSVSQ